jgi:hypothetical protein
LEELEERPSLKASLLEKPSDLKAFLLGELKLLPEESKLLLEPEAELLVEP